MNKFIANLPKYTLWVLFAISLVVSGIFIFGGSMDIEGNAGEMLSTFVYTDLFLNWTYILFALSVVITLIAAISSFFTTFAQNPKKGFGTLAVLVVFALVFVVSWFLGSPEELTIVGYEGTDNVGFWAQYSDMCLWATIIFSAATILALVSTVLYSKIKG